MHVTNLFLGRKLACEKALWGALAAVREKEVVPSNNTRFQPKMSEVKTVFRKPYTLRR